MDRIIENKQKYINHIIYSTIVFSLVYLFGLAIRLKLNISLQIISVFVLSTIVSLLLLYPILIYILLGIIFVSTLIISRFFTPYIHMFLERTYILFENIVYHLKGIEGIASENRFIFWGILVIFFSFYTGYIIFKSKRIYLLLPIYSGSFLYYWYHHFDEAYWMMALFLFFYFILMGLDKFSKEKMNIKNRANFSLEELYTPWLKIINRYSFIIVVLALLLPKSSKKIQWSWLQNKVQDTFPVVKELRSTDTTVRAYGKASLFDFSTTGFQEETSRLGGPVQINSNKIMTVRSDKPVYLRGSVRHTYTGDSWKSENYPWQIYPLRTDFGDLIGEERKKYYNETTVKITYNSFASTTLFSPYKASKVNFNGNHNIRVGYDDELIFPHGIYSGESYSIDVLEPLPYYHLVNIGIEKRKEDIGPLSMYLQIPEDKITESTRNLVKDIVKETERDIEKALAIEKYLRNNYKYNLGVEKVPENREFIDYFLFDSKEGYCTYYATTMAIMLRLEGIPSRYVEGYLARDEIKKGLYEVKQNNAHAWVEAFIEPVGWMTFEPTPAFPLMFRIEESTSKQPEGFFEGTDPSYIGVEDRSLWGNLHIPIMEMDEGLSGGTFQRNREEIPKFVLPNLPENWLIILVGIILLIGAMRFLIRFFQYKYEEAKIRKLPNDKRIIYLYNEIVELTKHLGYSKEPGETHYEFADRVARNLYFPYFTKEKGIKEI